MLPFFSALESGREVDGFGEWNHHVRDSRVHSYLIMSQTYIMRDVGSVSAMLFLDLQRNSIWHSYATFSQTLAWCSSCRSCGCAIGCSRMLFCRRQGTNAKCDVVLENMVCDATPLICVPGSSNPFTEPKNSLP